MRAHSDNAYVLAAWLREQPLVERVHYRGLAVIPDMSWRRANSVASAECWHLRWRGLRSGVAVYDATVLMRSLLTSVMRRLRSFTRYDYPWSIV